jgi:hypothetical protein
MIGLVSTESFVDTTALTEIEKLLPVIVTAVSGVWSDEQRVERLDQPGVKLVYGEATTKPSLYPREMRVKRLDLEVDELFFVFIIDAETDRASHVTDIERFQRIPMKGEGRLYARTVEEIVVDVEVLDITGKVCSGYESVDVGEVESVKEETIEDGYDFSHVGAGRVVFDTERRGTLDLVLRVELNDEGGRPG